MKLLNKSTLLVFLFIVSAAFSARAEDLAQLQHRPRIGLVLSGGGARGAAHVGVLKVLEENKVPVDIIVGTSMGAIVGGLYASGVSPAQMEKLFDSVDWKILFTDRPARKYLSFRHKEDRRQLIDFELGMKGFKPVLPEGLMAGQKLNFLLKSMTLPVMGIDDFNNLPIPYRAVAADLETGGMVVLSKGDLADSMRASMSVPGAFSPTEIDGRMLVDGGIVKNLPISIAKEMGADIIIAIDVSTPLSKREDIKSAIDVSMQVLAILTMQNVNEEAARLTKQDVLIKPDLGSLSSADFPKAPAIIKIGESAARAAAEELRRHSVPDGDFEQYLKKQRRRNNPRIKIDEIKVAKPRRVAVQAVESRLKTRPGEYLDTDKLQEDMYRVYSIGDFQEVDFDIDKQGDKNTLFINTCEKTWGPNYLRFGLNISDDFEGDAYYNFLAEYTRSQVNKLGAEWKNKFQIGRTRQIFSEFYQPLNYSEIFFVSPNVEYLGDVRDVYSDTARVAQYKVNSLGAGADVGVNFGTVAQARAGISGGKVRAGTLVGDQALPTYSIKSVAWKGSFDFDQLDDSNFPRYGILSYASIFMPRKGLGSDEEYNKAEVYVTKATTYGRHTFLASFDGGTNLGEQIPFYDEFTLGGFLSLSGYRKDELIGQYKGLGKVVYYYELMKIFGAWTDAVYVGGSLESGNTWNNSKEIRLNNLIYSGSAFVGADTIFGPLYLACGYDEKNEEPRFYLFLGQTF